MQPLAFVDCETTGLNPDLHPVWEVGLVVRRFADEAPFEVDEIRKQWFLPVDSLAFADTFALELNGFHDRHPHGLGNVDVKDGRIGKIADESVTDLLVFARQFAILTRGASLIGCVPSFDEERIRTIIRSAGLTPTWHYQPVDVETLAVGYLLNQHGSIDELELPWHSDSLAGMLGIDTSQFERHTALGDADLAVAMWEAVHAPS